MKIERIVIKPDPYKPFRLAQGYRVDNLLFISGQAAIDDEGKAEIEMRSVGYAIQEGKETAMVCYRCSGLMVREELADFAFGSGGDEPVGWRCVNCGAIVDPLITAHQRPRPMLVGRSQTK